MPHQRPRHALPALLKRLSFSRVVSLQGARQVGKSFIARELIPQKLPKALYVTLDHLSQQNQAVSSPENFLAKYEGAFPLLIDEAQKAPSLFDQIKYEVDVKNRPGQYVLLGSTEFSHELKIKESLTGRLSRSLIYPFTIAETLELELNPSSHFGLMNKKPRATRADLFRYLKNGGFPGIFHVREQAHREELFESWLRLAVERDLTQIKTMRLDADLASAIVKQLPLLEHPDLSSISKKVKASPKTVKNHLKALHLLFVVQPLAPHLLGTGKTIFRLVDVGLAHHLGQSDENSIRHWLLHEQLSQRACKLGKRLDLNYYRGAKGGIIDLVIADDTQNKKLAIKVLFEEKIDLRELAILHSFREKVGSAVDLCALAPVRDVFRVDGVTIYPYESIV